MLTKHAQLLRTYLDAAVNPLVAMSEAEVARKPSPTAWSPKEELGHLIDSASNNHLRFLNASVHDEYRGESYDQDASVIAHGYQDISWAELLNFWQRYNALLTKLIHRIPESKLGTMCTVGQNPPVTLAFLIEDYVLHMQHHLDHILGRKEITKYPGGKLEEL